MLEVDLLHNELNILYETKSALHAFDLSLGSDKRHLQIVINEIEGTEE